MKRVFTQMLIPKKSIGVLPMLGGMCLFLFTSFLVHTQQRAVSGTVKNESGQPLAQAEVLIASPSTDATTDADGRLLTHSLIKNELNQI